MANKQSRMVEKGSPKVKDQFSTGPKDHPHSRFQIDKHIIHRLSPWGRDNHEERAWVGSSSLFVGIFRNPLR